MSSKLKFRPVHLAVDGTREITYTPDGQEALDPEQRLSYQLRAPNKRVLEQINNAEIEMVLPQGGSANNDTTGRLNTGTTRRLFVMNCLVGWQNLYRSVIGTADEYAEVPFTRPGGQPGSALFEDAMARNYECVPEAHVVEMIKLLKSTSQVPDAVKVEQSLRSTSAGS